MVRSPVQLRQARVRHVVLACAALAAGVVLWSLLLRGGGAEVVDDSPRTGWQTIGYEGVRVTIPAPWERSDMGDCEFRFEHWGPPDAGDCGRAGGVAFYASATFDPAHRPGIRRLAPRDGTEWGGYTYADDLAVYVADDDRAIVQQVLRSVR